MIALTDAHYDEPARAACAVLADWGDARALAEYAVPIADPAPYVPGAFYTRELPALLAVLAAVREPIDVVVVDGHVWLDAGRPGLGAHLHAAIGLPVIGVAKRRYAGATPIEVRRGGSAVPLHVTAVGVDPGEAAAAIARMHGAHRLPTMLVRVDHLARGL